MSLGQCINGSDLFTQSTCYVYTVVNVEGSCHSMPSTLSFASAETPVHTVPKRSVSFRGVGIRKAIREIGAPLRQVDCLWLVVETVESHLPSPLIHSNMSINLDEVIRFDHAGMGLFLLDRPAYHGCGFPLHATRTRCRIHVWSILANVLRGRWEAFGEIVVEIASWYGGASSR